MVHCPISRRAAAWLPLAGTATLLVAGPVAAQPAWPSRPITVIVPLAAGSAADVSLRVLTERLSSVLKQPFVVENLPGAAGLPGTARAARAAADGHTLALLNSSIMTTLPHVYAKIDYDPLKSFAPITTVVSIPTVLVVHPSLPVKTVKELVALAKARPDQLLYSSGGVGSPQHLSMAMLGSMAGIRMTHVAYKGAVPATTDLVGGHVQLMFNGLATPLPHIRSGKLRALAMAGARRSDLLPELPTVQEAGVAGYEYEQWAGLFAPAATPPEIVARLNAESARILKSPDVKEKLSQLGLEAQGGSAEDLARAVRNELPRMAEIIRQVGIKPE
ncbi:MAG: tripartite tricarboxylate transporter substrate binding protein [Rhodocyclaceae bacterium]|nr:tripartite tricarboxylate transporter substrate binding protein [Rhodocyclaceae bacterium]MCA3075147.1 tripartite tricarboxylate transporter substrate binding protein [Rhodocyclaceae bacterium]MCA3089879.1 tripartite tricarboxylate transporter substrate binding protein [Rhodocyclaceae bacterium]MCA3093527.1 tripartite tricarboxylate transporter substrate binding protein [Rhodocyclaceae bacterium]MCA3096344.1 tripartite tricarboxylate transporter substrate binding protein [Rhodocyclaceae bact